MKTIANCTGIIIQVNKIFPNEVKLVLKFENKGIVLIEHNYGLRELDSLKVDNLDIKFPLKTE
jgi:hypothetical protein